MDTKDLLDALLKVSHLSDVHQFQGHPQIKSISVAEHSYYVAMCALLIGQYLHSQGRSNIEVIENAVVKALMHDVEECVTGDIPYPAKQHIKYETNGERNYTFAKYQFDVVKKLFDNIPNVLASWVASKSDDGSGHIVILADRLALVLYLIREVMLGSIYARDEIDTILSVMENESRGLLTEDISNELIERVKYMLMDAMIARRIYQSMHIV